MSKDKMQYGVMKTLEGGIIRIWTTTNEFKSNLFVGIGASKPKVWRTPEGAEKMVQKIGGTVFPIINGVMEY